MNQVFALWRENEQILVFRRLCSDGFSQALHVTANPRVTDSPQVESDFHAEP
jgi:hypothetical protein